MKILQVSMGLEFGGIESMELSLSNNINSNFTCDFLTPIDGIFKKNSYNLGCRRNNIISKIKYYIRLNKFLKNNKYDVVHINSSVFLFSFQVAKLSKKYNYRVVSHIHSVPKISFLKRIVINLLSKRYIRMVDYIIANSNNSKDNFLSKKYNSYIHVIPNGIDINKYKFNKKSREFIRNKYNFGDSKVFAYIGRFDLNKNLFYLIDIFKYYKDSYLLLIGDGSIKDKLKSRVEELGISDRVLFLGFMEDVSNILNGIDICIYPSLSEGFGLSIVECLTNGIEVYASRNIPKEINISPFFNYFDLDKKIKFNNKKLDRKTAYKYMEDFDIKKYVNKIERIYRGEWYEN